MACSTSLFDYRYDYHATAIEPLPSSSGAEEAKTSATLEIEGLRIRMLTQDAASNGEPAPRLALRMLFEPREIGYSFDPGQVALRGADGREWHPRVGGPGPPDGGTPSCNGGSEDPAEGEPRYSFLFPATCFHLSFGVAVEPATQWGLILAGLARGKRRLDPVVLRLSRKYWEAPPHDYDY